MPGGARWESKTGNAKRVDSNRTPDPLQGRGAGARAGAGRHIFDTKHHSAKANQQKILLAVSPPCSRAKWKDVPMARTVFLLEHKAAL